MCFFVQEPFHLFNKYLQMRKFFTRVILLLITASSFVPAISQTKTNTDLLRKASAIQAEKEKLVYQELESLAKKKGWEMVIKGKDGNIAILVGVDPLGLPQYLITESNLAAAATIGTSSLWPGGSAGLNLNGSSNNVKNKLAVWDGGRVRATHVELAGRVVQRDAPTSTSDHSTHVAGTLVASGVNPQAKGMSYGQQELVAYDFGNHLSEMMLEAPNLLVSNHSYGAIAGWHFNDGQNRWEFHGQFSANEDYKFGYYSSETQVFDSIAYNAPYYLIVKSSGNKRNENGPAVGQPYFRFDATGSMTSAGNRPAGISNNDGFDIIPTYGTAKNILTVGAVNAIPNGYTRSEDVVMSAFSSWGFTDDGRIKPDVVSNGVGLLSSTAGTDNSYSTFSGTSMASPSAAGSLLLLQEYYSQLHGGTFMRAATLKGLVIHTADEAGTSVGPDYQFGWGLINMKRAADVITSNNTGHIIHENVLNNTGTFSLPVIASGTGKITATISWTDPKADVTPVSLNNPNPKLVNDLDIVIKRGATTYQPWILDPSNPSGAATKGDNVRDNVEKIELTDVIPGETYTIEIKHKNVLARGLQAYSLIASGVGGQAYCASNPTSTAGARIDSVSFSNIQNKNVPGCTSYSDFKNLTAFVQPSLILPVFIRVNSCDATNANRIIKIFIDANNDGDFTDAGETLATSGVIAGNGDYNPSITIPPGLTEGKITILRIVMQETSNAADVNPCGTYARGETQDYRILIAPPATDAGVPGIISPQSGDCGSGEQYVTIRIRNHGSANISNIPVSTVIKQGTFTVATLSATYPGIIVPGAEVTFTYQNPFTAEAGVTYTITSTTGLGGDQEASNDENITTITMSAASSAPTGTAVACGNLTVLRANPVTNDFFSWYTSSTATTPIATGASANTATQVPTYYLSKNEVSEKLGPINKMVFPQGGYNTFTGNMVRITATTPVTLETAKLYIGHSGKITFLLRQIVSYNETTGAYTYFPVSSRTIDVIATAPTPPALNTQINDPADLGAYYYLGISIPAAGNYGIVIQCENGSSIFRNNEITSNPYPFSIPGIVSITGNSALLAGDPNYYQKFYYFFYDMTVELPNCPSARVPIVATTATAPTITLAGNVFTSSSATGNQWLRNGTPIIGANSQNYTATQDGNYKVAVTDAGGCTLESNQINFTTTSVPSVDPSLIAMIVSPNPTNTGQFNLRLEVTTRSDLQIVLLNAFGQRVYQYNAPGFVGRFNQQITPGYLAAGLYYLQVQHDKKMYVQKVVVGR